MVFGNGYDKESSQILTLIQVLQSLIWISFYFFLEFECEPLIQYKSCLDPNCFTPVLKSIGECQPYVGNCSSGSRVKVWKCLDKWNNEVPMKQCDWTPSDTEPCVLPCPGQCVMASWSAWEGCENACNNNSGKLAFQQRVMVMQGQGSSKNSGIFQIEYKLLYKFSPV